VPTNVLKEKTQYKKDLVHHQNNQGPGVIQCTAVVSMVKDKVAICGKTKDKIKQIFKADQEVALQLSESLCPDMSSTMYKIIGYTIE